MLELMMIVGSSPFDGLISTISNIILPIILFVVGVIAIRDAITGNITRLLTLVGVFVIALVIFLNPDILSGLGTSVGEEVSTAIE